MTILNENPSWKNIFSKNKKNKKFRTIFFRKKIKVFDEIFLKVHLLCLCYTLEPVVLIGIAFATLSLRGEGKNHVILPMAPTFSDRPSYRGIYRVWRDFRVYIGLGSI